MRPTGPAGVAARRRRVAAGGAVQPLQASSVCGVMARKGRCVAKAGVRDAARAASKHAEAWVCPPASCFLPPFRSASLSPAPLPPPGYVRPRANSGRRAGPAGHGECRRRVRCAGRRLRRRGLEKACRSSLSVSALDNRKHQVRVRGNGAVALDERAADRQNHRPASICSGTCLMETVRRGASRPATLRRWAGRPANPPRPGAEPWSPAAGGRRQGSRLVPLAEARDKALANRKLARDGGDPLADGRPAKRIPLFAAAAERAWNQSRQGWRHPRHACDWWRSFENYVLPHRPTARHERRAPPASGSAPSARALPAGSRADRPPCSQLRRSVAARMAGPAAEPLGVESAGSMRCVSSAGAMMARCWTEEAVDG